MSRVMMVQECDQALQALLPNLPRPEQKALAALVCGVVLSRGTSLPVASAAMPGHATTPSKVRRAQRLVANPRLDVSRSQGHLAAHLVGGWQGRLDVLVDPTPTGATASYAGTETLAIGVAWHKRWLPLWWRSRRRERGATPTWQAMISQAFDRLSGVVTPNTQPVVLADRGLTGRPLLEQILHRGWHYLLRCERTTRIRLSDGTVTTLGALVPAPGAPSRFLTQVQIFAPRVKLPPGRRHKEGAGTWQHRWSQALTTNVVAVGPPTTRDPWLLLTDLPPCPARCTEYRRRMWEEEGFRDWKSSGWNWQRCRLRQPARIDRLLLVLALATVWMAALAQRLIRAGRRRVLEPAARRCYSYFQLGLRYLDRLLANDQPIPVCLRLLPEARAPVKLS
ncbi:MAG TPA: transposase [Chloroflexota bacterium]|nr:transposase [Chloroflexota bacterium]